MFCRRWERPPRRAVTQSRIAAVWRRGGLASGTTALWQSVSHSARLAPSLPGLSSAHPPILQMVREAKPVAQIHTAGLWQKWLVQGEGWAGFPTSDSLHPWLSLMLLPALCTPHLHPCSVNYLGHHPASTLHPVPITFLKTTVVQGSPLLQIPDQKDPHPQQ